MSDGYEPLRFSTIRDGIFEEMVEDAFAEVQRRLATTR